MATQTFKGLSDYQYGFAKPENYAFKSKKGLDLQVVKDISGHKGEPVWMQKFRAQALLMFESKKMPGWGGDMSGINFDDIYYYIKPTDGKARTWEDLPPEIKDTYDRIGIPEAEKNFLAGVSAQYECITGDALIFGSQIATPLKDIKPGSYVYALNEQTKKLEKQKVLGIAKKGKRPVYKIKVAGRTIQCTQNHPLLKLKYTKIANRQRGKFSTEWEYFKNLSVGDYIGIIKDTPDLGVSCQLPSIDLTKSYRGKNQVGTFPVNANWLYTRKQKMLSIPHHTNKDLMWLIGLYIGDGYITKDSKETDKKVLNIAIPSNQKDIRKRLQSVLKSVFKYQVSFGKEKYRVRIHAKPIIALFEKLELSGSAQTKKIPSWIHQLPRSQKLAFIAGYIDSDGYMRVSKKNCDVWITSINKKLLQSTQILGITSGLHVTGIHAFSYHPDIKDKKRVSKGYRLQITGNLQGLTQDSCKVKKSFVPRKYYHTYGSHHKSSIASHISNQLGFAPIQEITYLGEKEVYDIAVKGHHNFVANGIVVHNSEVVYKSINKQLEKQGVIFTDMDTALREYPEIVKQYFSKLIPPVDNKFAALNSAVWSGGSFVYVPKGVEVKLPLQAYFRINAANMGQFERTLIIAEEGSYVHYVEGCTAPIYSTDSLHSAVVEIFVKKGARVRYTTVQNWSNNVYNLVTKRARVEEDGVMEWVDANLGSKLTMKYPSVVLVGKGARGEVLSIAYAGKGQHQDAGAKAIHIAPYTTSKITSKSISKGGGRATYRGLLHVAPEAVGSKSKVVCDALLLDENSRSDTYPTMRIKENDVQIEHEATVSKVGEEQLFYLQSRGLSQELAESMVVNGFIEPIVKEIPLEYAVEMNRLIQLQMIGSVG